MSRRPPIWLRLEGFVRELQNVSASQRSLCHLNQALHFYTFRVRWNLTFIKNSHTDSDTTCGFSTSLVVLWLKSWGGTEILLPPGGSHILVTCHQSNTSHEKDMINVRFSASCRTLSEWEQLCCMMRIGTDKLDWAAFIFQVQWKSFRCIQIMNF